MRIFIHKTFYAYDTYTCCKITHTADTKVMKTSYLSIYWQYWSMRRQSGSGHIIISFVPRPHTLTYRGFPKVRHHHSNACGRHFVWVQIRDCTILDCTITTIMNTSLYVDGIPGAFPTKYMVYYCILAVRMAGYSLQIVWLDRHITTSQVHG